MLVFENLIVLEVVVVGDSVLLVYVIFALFGDDDGHVHAVGGEEAGEVGVLLGT